MKKIITLLLISVSAIILSSCIVVTDHDHSHHSADLTFVNDTQEYITDWYAEDNYGDNYTESDFWTSVLPGKSSKLYDLDYGTYRVRFTYDSNSHPYYYRSDYTYIDADTTFYLSDESFFYNRSAEGISESTEPHFVLTDNKGNKIPLELVD